MKVCTFKKKKKIIWKCGQFLNVNNHLKGYEGLERERKQRGEKENGVGAWCSFLLSSLLQQKLHAKP